MRDMGLQLPLKIEQWQTAYSRDDAYDDSGKHAAVLGVAMQIGRVLALVYTTVYLAPTFAFLNLLPSFIKKGASIPWPLVTIYLFLGVFLLVIVYLLFSAVQITAFRFASEFMLEFYRPPATVKPEEIVNLRLYGKTKFPPPFNLLSQLPYIIVKNGDIEKKGGNAAWSARYIGGPIMLIIFDGNALYLERGNRFSRVVGPGNKIPFLEWYETIKYVVDLRPKIKEGEIDVWTKDGIRIKLTVKIECRISDSAQQPASSNLVYPYDPSAIKKAVERCATRWPDCPTGEPIEFNWLDATWGQVTGIVPNYIGSRMLDDLVIADRNNGQILSPDAMNEIRKNVGAKTQEFGICITDFQVEQIQMPLEAEQALRELWKAEKEGQVTEDEGRTAASQIRAQEDARAKAQQDLIENIANELKKNKNGNPAEPLLLSFSRILDESLSEPLMRAYLAKETLETLEKIQEMLK